MTTRNDIFETFWPALSTREATNVFHVTKRKISEVLKTDLTVYFAGFYRVAPNLELSYDATQFFQAAQDAEILDADEAIPLLERALYIYQAPFLAHIDLPWVEKRRGEVEQAYLEAMIALAKLLEERGESERALGLYLQASRMNRQREDIAYNIMRLYRANGLHGDALAVYDRLRDELKHQLNVEPAAQIQALRLQIADEMAEQSPVAASGAR
jgi:two-component SAPR family response regulator